MSLKNSIFNELREQRQFCDVVVRVENREFTAHKIILCNCSPYFRALFTRWSPPDCRVFDVSDIPAHIMELIIHYAYNDTLPVMEKDVLDLYQAADRLNIMGIVQVCRNLLQQHLSPLNCIRIWRFSDTYCQPELTSKALLFTLTHFEEVVASSDEFSSLSVEEFQEILENDSLSVKEERIVYEAILNWIDAVPEERQQHFGHLLSKVRLAHVGEEYITNCILKNPMVRDNLMCKDILQNALEVIPLVKENPSSKFLLLNPLACPRLPSEAMLAFGGRTDSNVHCTTIQAYDYQVDRWVKVGSGDVRPRSHHGTIFLDGFVYCVGGRSKKEHLSSVHRLHLETKTWQEVVPMYSKRSNLSVTVLDGCIYAIGGYDGNCQLETGEFYQPEIYKWTEIASMQERRSNASCVAFNGKVYIFGGINWWGYYMSSAECYDPQTDEWTLIANMDRRCAALGVVVYDKKIYTVGGRIRDSHMDFVDAYDPDSNTWHREVPMLKCRSNFGIAVLDGRIFVVGGVSNSGNLYTVECYDARTAQWSYMCDLGVCRYALSCCVVHGLGNMTDYSFPRHSPE